MRDTDTNYGTESVQANEDLIQHIKNAKEVLDYIDEMMTSAA